MIFHQKDMSKLINYFYIFIFYKKFVDETLIYVNKKNIQLLNKFNTKGCF